MKGLVTFKKNNKNILNIYFTLLRNCRKRTDLYVLKKDTELGRIQGNVQQNLTLNISTRYITIMRN